MVLTPKCRSVSLDPSMMPDPWDEYSDLAFKSEPLIPGLPESIALNCLLRVPVDNQNSLKAVCKTWYWLFGNKRGHYFARRKELSFRDPWIFVFASHKDNLKLMAFNLANFSWLTLSDVPHMCKISPDGFRTVALSHEGVLFFCGGTLSDNDYPINLTYKYEVQSGRWNKIRRMISARSFFGAGVIDGKVYITGGNGKGMYKVNSTEVMDPISGTWRCVASMDDMTSYDSIVVDGKFYVIEGWNLALGGVPSGQIYDPRTDSWEDMPIGLRIGWTGLSVMIDGRLFNFSENEGKKVKVYENDKDEWEDVESTELEMNGPFRVTYCNNKIFVVGEHLNIAIGTVMANKVLKECEEGYNNMFFVKWDVVNSPALLVDFLPSSAHVVFA